MFQLNIIPRNEDGQAYLLPLCDSPMMSIRFHSGKRGSVGPDAVFLYYYCIPALYHEFMKHGKKAR